MEVSRLLGGGVCRSLCVSGGGMLCVGVYATKKVSWCGEVVGCFFLSIFDVWMRLGMC